MFYTNTFKTVIAQILLCNTTIPWVQHGTIYEDVTCSFLPLLYAWLNKLLGLAVLFTVIFPKLDLSHHFSVSKHFWIELQKFLIPYPVLHTE